MTATGWYLALALTALSPASVAQEFDANQTFEKPSWSFGNDSDLGKYNYLGKILKPGEFQLPGESSPFTLDQETLKNLQKCRQFRCVDYSYQPYFDVGQGKYGQIQTNANVTSVPPAPVASDEVRLNNPQGVELGLRLTVAGIASVVNIKAADSFTRKLAAGETATAEISSGSTVTTTSLQPGKAYAIEIVSGAYFIVPAN